VILSNWGTPIWPGSPGIALHVRRCFGLSKYEAVRGIPDNTRDWAECIQLVILCYEKHVSVGKTFFGWKKVLEPLINDLRSLEKNGISISIANKTINFVDTIVAMLGDNLGSH